MNIDNTIHEHCLNDHEEIETKEFDQYEDDMKNPYGELNN